ncbi:hypothetical protein R1flu_021037 [Riccia fluitans]|uniref:Uncharacterized protein n=1 Tax=Riccia fluitans TaxID=41844 RepID=A0ABD1ZRX1_9MARC
MERKQKLQNSMPLSAVTASSTSPDDQRFGSIKGAGRMNRILVGSQRLQGNLEVSDSLQVTKKSAKVSHLWYTSYSQLLHRPDRQNFLKRFYLLQISGRRRKP